MAGGTMGNSARAWNSVTKSAESMQMVSHTPCHTSFNLQNYYFAVCLHQWKCVGGGGWKGREN